PHLTKYSRVNASECRSRQPAHGKIGRLPSVKRLDFIFFDAGGGHRSAANALKAVIEQQGRPWEIRLANLQEVLDRLDIFRKLTGVRMQDVYNHMLKKGFTLGSGALVVAMHAIIRLYHRQQVKLLTEWWKRNGAPDLASTTPSTIS